jgi:hypothetical protein
MKTPCSQHESWYAQTLKAQQRKPQGYAGVTIWGGDATVTKCFTQIQIEQVRSPRALVEFAVQECLNELAAHGITASEADDSARSKT